MTRKKVTNKKISFDSLEFLTYEKVREKIFKVVGKKPKFPSDLPEGIWTEQSLKVLRERYLLKNCNGKIIETPEEMCWRVSWEVASSEAVWGKKREQILKQTREFYKLLVTHEFLPNSPTLMNAGVGNSLQYSGCFVIPVEDSLIGIFDALKYQALIHQTGGGTGFSFNRLRPRGSIVKSSMGVASGPVSFMKIFDSATNEIKQGGKRRGANMGILRVDHPDIKEFIYCKKDGEITNFNISVAITDKFMEAYKNKSNYDLIDPKSDKKAGSLNTVEVFDEIAKLAWKTGDPGLIFIDRINKGKANPVPSLGPIESTNPCGELPLYPFDSCNLGSIFLTYFVKEKDSQAGEREVDWEKLKRVTRTAVRFLDDVIEVNPYTLPEIRKTTLAIRRIGLGVGGWADMLVQLGIRYDSKEALELAERVMKTIEKIAIEESKQLAKERGPFPLWSESIYKRQKPRRNSTLTTIAPTGSISIIAGASSGIEPLFAIAYQHIVKDKHLHRKLSFINPYFKNLAIKQGFWSEELEKKVLAEGTIKHISEIPKEVREIFMTAHEIDLDWHVNTQASFQKYIENAVSKTINLSNGATVEDVKKAYLLAWDRGCKGITIFRDGSKSLQVLNVGIKKEEKQKKEVIVEQAKLPEKENGEAVINRPYVINGSTYRLVTPVGSAFITINEDENKMPMEVFINVGKAGSDVAAMAEALGRTISTTLRLKGEINPKERVMEIAKQLSGIGGRKSVGFGQNKIRSLPDAISVAISKHYGFKINGNGKEVVKTAPSVVGAAATALSSALVEPKDLAAALTTPEAVLKKKKELIDGELLKIPLEDRNLEDKNLVVSERIVGDICPSCGLSTLIYQEGCAKCYSCSYSEC